MCSISFSASFSAIDYHPFLSLLRRQCRVFGWRVNRRFVRIMTHAGTRRLLLVALFSLSFFPSVLWVAMV